MKWLSSIRNFLARKKRIKKIFFTIDGGKEVIHKKRLFGTLVIVVFGGAGSAFFFSAKTDTSFLKKSDHGLSGTKNEPSKSTPSSSGAVGKMLQNSEGEAPPARGTKGGSIKINYKSKQVLVSEGAFDQAQTMPIGTNLIGKTLTTIDTRFADQLVKVLLPYGGSAKSSGELPKNSILFGQITYGGKGDKVSIKFSKGVLPNGEEFQVEATTLSPKDYSPGIAGQFHGNGSLRVASTLGLTMVAGMSDVLTEKESIGGSVLQAGAVTPKANMKNAMYHGLSQVAQNEVNSEAQAIGQEQEYVSIDAGTDLIVSLTKAYIEK